MRRREVLRSLALTGGGLVAGLLVSSCGDDRQAAPPGGPGVGRRPGLAVADVSRARGSASAQPDAAGAVRAFAADLYGSLAASTSGNLVCSPYSIAVALAMTRNGARASTAHQIDAVLHAPPLDKFNGGLNALTQHVDGLAGEQVRRDKTKATIALDVANSLWGQRDTAWRSAFLDALARNYGAGMRLVDYRTQSAAARILINRWTAEQTHGRISHIIPPGVLDDLTRLVLVNAVYLKAPWEETFTARSTRLRPFHLDDGSQVDAQTMSAGLSEASYGAGPGWKAVRLCYAGRRIAMTVVVPDGRSLDELESSLDGPALTQVMTGPRPVSELYLRLPRWRFRVQARLNGTLSRLGMPIAFDPSGADFSGMTADEQLYISHVLHQAFISVDEHGTEAAAATAVVVAASSGSSRSVVVDVDRPFLFVIHDLQTSTPLFVGRVSDPTG